MSKVSIGLNMRSIQIIIVLVFSAFTFSSCNKEKEFDVDVNVAEPTEQMAVGNTLNVEVVNELDPICGMTTADHLKDTAEYKGKTYGFCNTMCKEEFLKDPEKHIHE